MVVVNTHLVCLARTEFVTMFDFTERVTLVGSFEVGY